MPASLFLTKNFKLNEFKNTIDLRTVLELQKIRDTIKKPITIIKNDLYYVGYQTDSYSAELKLNYDYDIPIYGDCFIHDTNKITIDYWNSASKNIKNAIVALFQYSYDEGENNNTHFGKFFKMNFNPWCSMFFHWCGIKSGMMVRPLRYGYASARESYKNMPIKKTKEQVVTGDGLFWGDRGKPTGHVGMCLYNDINKKTIYSIEGNSGDSVSVRIYAYDNLETPKREFLGGGNHAIYTENVLLFNLDFKAETSENTR